MIDLITDLPLEELGRLNKKKLEQALFEIFELLPSPSTRVELKLVKSDEMRSFNHKYRQKDKPTDVLSFPFGEKGLLGSIIIDVDTARQQAKEYKQTFEEEVLELFVHGVLHLLGMDHESQPDADLMKSYENFIGKRLKRRSNS